MAEKEIVKETKEEKNVGASTDAPSQESKDNKDSRGGFNRGGFNRGGRPPFKRMSREERAEEARKKALDEWKPKTLLGKQVLDKKIKDIDEIIDRTILEDQIVDSLIKLGTYKEEEISFFNRTIKR